MTNLDNNSFSAKTKAELFENTKNINSAEILGLLFLNKNISEENVAFFTKNHSVCSYIAKCLSESLQIIVDITEKNVYNKKMYILAVPFGKDRQKICNLLNKKHKLKKLEDIASFFKGAFMAFGAVPSPENSYRVEFFSYNFELAQSLKKLLETVYTVELSPKIAKKRKQYIIYIDGSEETTNLLTFIGATNAAMDLMQIKMLKELRNNVNRTTNFETANISKIAKISALQIDKINKIISAVGGLENLPKNLQEIAALRLKNPELSLKDLGEKMTPTLSRSGVYHRMQKLLNYKW